MNPKSNDCQNSSVSDQTIQTQIHCRGQKERNTDSAHNPLPEQVAEAVERSDSVLKEARQKYDFDKVFAAVSGGNDSQTALTVTHRSDELDLDGVIFIDTGINISQTKEFVRQEAEKRGLEFHCVGDEYALETEGYKKLLKVYGFPGPPQHNHMFFNLKGKRLNRFLKETGGTIGLISGVLQDESTRRMENIGDDPIEEKSHGIWISPIYDWLEETVDKYREHLDLRENDVTAMLHVSGDCNCGAYGQRAELLDLKSFYPEAAKEIARLEEMVGKRVAQGKIPAEYALWAHGRDNPLDMDAPDDTEQQFFDTCSGCEQKCGTEYDRTGKPLTKAEAYLRRNDLSLAENTSVYCVECDIVAENGREHREKVHPNASASPKKLDIRAIHRRCSDAGSLRVTEGEISTRNPDGQFCDRASEHRWEFYDGPNDVAERKCTKCGAFEVPIHPEGEHVWPKTAAETPHDPFELLGEWLREKGQPSISTFSDS